MMEEKMLEAVLLGATTATTGGGSYTGAGAGAGEAAREDAFDLGAVDSLFVFNAVFFFLVAAAAPFLGVKTFPSPLRNACLRVSDFLTKLAEVSETCLDNITGGSSAAAAVADLVVFFLVALPEAFFFFCKSLIDDADAYIYTDK
jgi:hypothetical protein